MFIQGNITLKTFRTSLVVFQNYLMCTQFITFLCNDQGSRDNMSMVLVTFPACPPPVEDAGVKEAALEEVLKNRVTELVNEADGKIELPHILQTLTDENIPDLPPGGGLYAKYVYILTDNFNTDAE